MTKNLHRKIKISVIFAIIEGAILYYLVVLGNFVLTTGFGRPHYNYLPGVNYILERYFHTYWALPVVYTGNPNVFNNPQVIGGELFMDVFQNSLIIGFALTAVIYFLKLRSLMKVKVRHLGP